MSSSIFLVYKKNIGGSRNKPTSLFVRNLCKLLNFLEAILFGSNELHNSLKQASWLYKVRVHTFRGSDASGLDALGGGRRYRVHELPPSREEGKP